MDLDWRTLGRASSRFDQQKWLTDQRMTEAEWDTCTEPQKMLAFLRDNNADARKMRLLACARWHWVGIVEAEYRQAIEVAEKLADETATFGDLRNADLRIWELHWGPVAGEAEANRAACATVIDFAGDAAEAAVTCFPDAAPALIREVFGNPFRHGAISHHVTAQLRSVAENICHEHNFPDLPRLAELLVDSGFETRPSYRI
jgi:hypothetical protein